MYNIVIIKPTCQQQMSTCIAKGTCRNDDVTHNQNTGKTKDDSRKGVDFWSCGKLLKRYDYIVF